MEIKAVINDKYTSPEVHVCNNTLTHEVENIINDLNTYFNDDLLVTASNGDKTNINHKDICRVYASDSKVYIQTIDDLFTSSHKLYELENMLDSGRFFRISKSEIINLKKIKKLDMSTMGTIKIYLSGDIETYTSRRNVSKLKEILGL